MSSDCPVCLESYTGNEIVLSCKHSVCDICRKRILKTQGDSFQNSVYENNVRCPICRTVCEHTYEELVELVVDLKVTNSALEHDCLLAEYQLSDEEEHNKNMLKELEWLRKYREQSKTLIKNLIQDNERKKKELEVLRSVGPKKYATRLMCQATSGCETRTPCRCSHADCNIPACSRCGKKCAQHRV